MKTCIILALAVSGLFLAGCANDDDYRTTTHSQTHTTMGYGK